MAQSNPRRFSPDFLSRIASNEPTGDFPAQLPHIRRAARQQISACRRAGIEAYTPYWREITARHTAEHAAFDQREASFIGRLKNIFDTMPSSGIRAAVSHIRNVATKPQLRAELLVQRQYRERHALSVRQNIYEQKISRPYRDILEMNDQALAQAFLNPFPAIQNQNDAKLHQRQRALIEISRSLSTWPQTPENTRRANRDRSPEIEHEQEQ